MTDLHTHILPGMDDGARDIDTALKMLAAEAKQGVNTVALTPHFYRSKERTSDFLKRRETAWSKLQQSLHGAEHPHLILSAEVSYAPGMADWDELPELCYEGTKLLLVEPPMTPWNDEMLRQLYAVEGRRGITPMIAHFDRYLGMQPKARIEQLLDMGFPIQVSAEALLRIFARAHSLRLFTEYSAVLISDCHDLDSRQPNMEEAARILVKKLGNNAKQILLRSEELLRL